MSHNSPKKQIGFDSILNKIRKESKDTVELGTKFEKLTKLFLEAASPYNHTYKNICLWKDWKYNDGHDTGIDLVAETNDGQWCAIQCKCYDDQGNLDSSKVDSFFSKSSSFEKKHKKKFHLILVYTGDTITHNAYKKIVDHGCQVIDQQVLRAANIIWNDFPQKLSRIESQTLRPYQKEAVDRVVAGISQDSRGKLIMACGTGKTLTSLRIAEKHAGIGKTVLYLVPSITLIQQTISSWSANAQTKYSYEAVCSDSSVNVKDDDSNLIDDGNILDIPIPATTNVKTLKDRLSKKKSNVMTVLFSTYHSLDIVQQAMGGKAIDLILCDEAHRTTGIEGAMFQKVHDDQYITAKKRVYMTATPKQFTEKLKKKHDTLIDMDDESVYGKSLYKYSFTQAVDNKDLCDFKVRVPVFSTDDIQQYVQESIDGADDGTIDERVLFAAVWHALNYGENKAKLLQRVIAFGNTIRASEKFSGIYGELDQTVDEEQYRAKQSKIDDKDLLNRSMLNAVSQYEEKKDKHTGNTVSVRHVDGTQSSNIRHKKMDWLESSSDNPRECRILSNARCLSEGVDIPALDGVIFLQPRKSQVDVVQAVGRVMRKVRGKDYGHIIIPVVLQKDTSLHESLETNKAWKSVWQVVKALRSHDPDFGKKIDKLALTHSDGAGEVPENIEIIFMGSLSAEPAPKLLGAITSQLVKKCGDRGYYDSQSKELGIKAKLIEKVLSESYHKTKDEKIRNVVNTLHIGLQSIINDSVTIGATIQVMAQHYALSQVFNALFDEEEFIHDNPVVRVLDDAIHQIGLTQELEPYKEFFEVVRKETTNFKNPEEKETYVKTIYNSFLEGFDKKRQESDGIVYTPTEVVDFIIHSVEHVLKTKFGTGFNNKDVKVFDPFTGTGTFVTRLLESQLIAPENLKSKYKKDIWANEISLLAYYVAAINIESVFRRISKIKNNTSFRNINYTDTLYHNPKYRVDSQHRQKSVTLDGEISKVQDSIQKSKWTHIHVIMGNPPYSSGQSNYNDENPNVVYSKLDDRIKETYAKRAKTTNKYSLYDSYIRSIRWASDRIGESGIVAFVTNGSFIQSDTTAGLRACLKEEFSEIWCFDLRGNQRTQGETSKKEGGKIFGSGSRAPVAITILVKDLQKLAPPPPPAAATAILSTRKCSIHYCDIGDYHDRKKKLEIIAKFKSIKDIKNWQTINPDRHNDWLNQRDDELLKYTSMGNKDTKTGKNTDSIFKIYSLGIATNRDAWVYNSSKEELSKNMKCHIDYCNGQDILNPKIDPTQAKWNRELLNRLRRYGKEKFDNHKIRTVLYRPFFKQSLYYDNVFNSYQGQIPKIFPKEDSDNLVIAVPSKDNKKFSTFVTNITPDLHLVGDAQCFPLYTYNNDKKQENITDTTLEEYQTHYKYKKITKKDIFYYVYGLLHHKGYRKKFRENLMRDLPLIPMAPDFQKFCKIGKKLADLHLAFDSCKLHDLGNPKFIPKKFIKLSFGKKKEKIDEKEKSVTDKSILKADGAVLYDTIPNIKYSVNGRTPLEWIIDRYKVTVDKDSLIKNDPCTGTDIIPIIRRAVYLGVESDRLIKQLPKEFEPKNWTAKKTGLEQFV